MTKGKEKAEVLNVLFASVFINKTIFSLGTQHSELVDRNGEQNEALIMQEKTISDLLHHLDAHKSMGLDGIHPKVLRELAVVLTKALSVT